MDEYITVNGVLYKRVTESAMTHAEFHLHSFQGMAPNCEWKMLTGGRKWRCQHGVEVTEHPRGYCDGGCCR